MQATIATIILAAGSGSRMKSSLPKVLHLIGAKPMLWHVVRLAEKISSLKPVVVISAKMPHAQLTNAYTECSFAIQEKQLGTADAVKAAMPNLSSSDLVAILYGDTPLVEQDTITRAAEALMQNSNAALCLISFHETSPNQYARIVAEENVVLSLAEYKDATDEQRSISLCNSGIIIAKRPFLEEALPKIDNLNAAREYYLTDLVKLAHTQGSKVVHIVADKDEMMGVNSKAELAKAESLFQERAAAYWLEQGVTLTHPSSVTFAADLKIGYEVTIGPYVVFGEGVSIKNNVTIKSFVHLEGCNIGEGTVIGPYARIRPGSVIGEYCRIGNFVEIKNTKLGPHVKANHLSYLGDTVVGEKANIGAGTITCNFDGKGKHQTTIGAEAFIGSNTSLVAPVSIGNHSVVGAGSVVTKNVPDEYLAIARGYQVNLTRKR